MKQIEFFILTYIEVTAKELAIITIVLTDIGLEVTCFRQFLFPRWEKLPPNKKSKSKEFIQRTIAHLKFIQNNVPVIFGKKFLTFR